jgi:hypothetical protein
MTASATTANENLGASWRAALTRQEIDDLLELDDLQSWLSIGVNWAIVFASLAWVAV